MIGPIRQKENNREFMLTDKNCNKWANSDTLGILVAEDGFCTKDIESRIMYNHWTDRQTDGRTVRHPTSANQY